VARYIYPLQLVAVHLLGRCLLECHPYAKFHSGDFDSSVRFEPSLLAHEPFEQCERCHSCLLAL
jgi:hypothetical protein